MAKKTAEAAALSIHLDQALGSDLQLVGLSVGKGPEPHS